MINKDHTVEKCKDDISLIENYDKAINDTTQTWHCHHRLEISLDGKNELHSKEDLIRLGMYYKRPYFELIFLTPSEHRRLHNGTIEAIERNRKSQTGLHCGSKNPMFGKHEPKRTSEFGNKYFNHYGYSKSFNVSQYTKEYNWYNKHGKCSWE